MTSDIIIQEISSLKNQFNVISRLSDDFVFSLVCAKYFMTNGEFSFADDYTASFTDGSGDGGIDLIKIDEDSSGAQSLALIQAKMHSEISDSTDVIDWLQRIDQTVKAFDDNRYNNFSNKLKRIYLSRYNELDSPPNIQLILFINCDPSPNLKKKIADKIKNNDILQNYNISTYYKEDIVNQINEIKNPKSSVSEDKIKWSNTDSKLKYGENAIIVNISALSLRDLYLRKKDDGLFEQNFRFFTKVAKVDNKINNSLNSRRNDFWFLNNGITICCSDFRVDGTYIKLYNFSIINGCQTTTLIGKYNQANENEDFYLTCKIIKPNESLTNEKKNIFISEIAEASNSQKPIKDRDLKSNYPEQRRLQNQFKEKNIYIEIKRGEVLCSRSIRSNLEKWQYTTNELFGQKMLSFQFQMPGTARSKKSSLFGTDQIYQKVFRQNYNVDTSADILKIFDLFNSYKDKYVQDEELALSSPENLQIVLNGAIHIPSIVGFLLKLKRGSINTTLLSDKEKWKQEVSSKLLHGNLFISNLPDDYQIIIESLFHKIVVEVKRTYTIYSASNPKATVTNFLKKDDTYYNLILKDIINALWLDSLTKNALLSDNLHIFEG